jgi:hypothetical protein
MIKLIKTIFILCILVTTGVNAYAEDDDDSGPRTPKEIRADLKNSLSQHLAEGFVNFLILRCVPDELLENDSANISEEQADIIEQCVRKQLSNILSMRKNGRGMLSSVSPKVLKSVAYEVITQYSESDVGNVDN